MVALISAQCIWPNMVSMYVCEDLDIDRPSTLLFGLNRRLFYLSNIHSFRVSIVDNTFIHVLGPNQPISYDELESLFFLPLVGNFIKELRDTLAIVTSPDHLR